MTDQLGSHGHRELNENGDSVAHTEPNTEPNDTNATESESFILYPSKGTVFVLVTVPVTSRKISMF